MKNLKIFLITIGLLTAGSQILKAQSDERRNKLVMVITQGGKSVTTELSSVGTGINRYPDEAAFESPASKKDTAKTKAVAPPARGTTFYLTINALKASNELLSIFAKSKARFDGTITITDQYGKNPVKTIKFKQASLYSYNDQASTSSYDDMYGSVAISLDCKQLAVNGVNFEP